MRPIRGAWHRDRNLRFRRCNPHPHANSSIIAFLTDPAHEAMHRPARVVRFTSKAAAVDLTERYDALRARGRPCIAQRFASGCRVYADRLSGDGGIPHSLLEAAYANYVDELAAGAERYRLFRAN